MILGSPHVEAVGKERMRLFLGMISHGVSTCKKSSVAAEPVDEVAMNIVCALRTMRWIEDCDETVTMDCKHVTRESGDRRVDGVEHFLL